MLFGGHSLTRHLPQGRNKGDLQLGSGSHKTKPPPEQGFSEWAILDSNQGPPPYQSGALTN